MQTLAAIFALMLLPIIGSGGELTTLSSCICTGYEAVFECVVADGGATIWSGTALDHCTNDRITLRHSRFNQPGYNVSGICGDSGQIIGRAVSAVNDSYTSQFVINVSQSIIGANVECARRSDRMLHIGREQILRTTAPLPPPSNVTLSKINSSHLTFTWNPVSPDCQAVHYKINATNCGQCPNTADSNSVTCTIPTKIAFEQNCVFTVQTVVCGNVSGIPSEPIVFAMKVPNAPRINATSEYLGETKKLIKISVELVTSGLLGHYNITDDISYTINYTDITSGSTCGSVTLPASSCDDGVCTTVFEVSSSLCSPQSDINISAFAINIFGDGQLSDSIHIGAINHFVDIDFDFIATNAIKCTFLNQRLGTPKSCSIEYGPKEETHCSNSQQSLISSKGNPITMSSDTVSIILHPSTKYGTEYCYQLTASDGITTVIINGTFAACDPDQLSDGKSVREDIVCGASHNALGMENGFVCYSGTKVGSTAMHYCYDCGFSSVQGPLIRTCGRNGLWNGSIPRCECNHFSTDLAPILIGTIGGIVVLIFTGTIMIFAIIIIVLYKTKARLNKQLLNQQHAHGKDIIDIENKIYEEIDPMPQPKMDTENNVAYASCRSIMRSASCAYQLQFSNNK